MEIYEVKSNALNTSLDNIRFVEKAVTNVIPGFIEVMNNSLKDFELNQNLETRFRRKFKAVDFIVGGSIAAYLCGVYIRMGIYDVDLVVSSKGFDRIELMINEFDSNQCESKLEFLEKDRYSCSDSNNRVLRFIYDGIIIDIIESVIPMVICSNSTDLKIADEFTLMAFKCCYDSPKDLSDLVEFLKLDTIQLAINNISKLTDLNNSMNSIRDDASLGYRLDLRSIYNLNESNKLQVIVYALKSLADKFDKNKSFYDEYYSHIIEEFLNKVKGYL